MGGSFYRNINCCSPRHAAPSNVDSVQLSSPRQVTPQVGGCVEWIHVYFEINIIYREIFRRFYPADSTILLRRFYPGILNIDTRYHTVFS